MSESSWPNNIDGTIDTDKDRNRNGSDNTMKTLIAVYIAMMALGVGVACAGYAMVEKAYIWLMHGFANIISGSHLLWVLRNQ